jgi:hypothetical protein
MALTIENGTGLSTATAYISVDDADTYHSDRGNDAWAAATFADKERAIVRGTDFIDTRYRFRGTRLYETQALSWPRVDAYDDDGFLLDGLPAEVEKATAEAALRALSGDLDPDRERGGQIARQKVGEVEVEYAQGAPSRTVYARIDAILHGLTIRRTRVFRT